MFWSYKSFFSIISYLDLNEYILGTLALRWWSLGGASSPSELRTTSLGRLFNFLNTSGDAAFGLLTPGVFFTLFIFFSIFESSPLTRKGLLSRSRRTRGTLLATRSPTFESSKELPISLWLWPGSLSTRLSIKPSLGCSSPWKPNWARIASNRDFDASAAWIDDTVRQMNVTAAAWEMRLQIIIIGKLSPLGSPFLCSRITWGSGVNYCLL